MADTQGITWDSQPKSASGGIKWDDEAPKDSGITWDTAAPTAVSAAKPRSGKSIPNPTRTTLSEPNDTPPQDSVSEIAAERKAGGLGQEKIGKTTGPGDTLGGVASQLGELASKTGERLNEAGTSAIEGISGLGKAVMEQRDPLSAVAEGAGRILNVPAQALRVGSAIPGAASEMITKAAGLSPEEAQESGNKAELATQMLMGGKMTAEHAMAGPGEEATNKAVNKIKARMLVRDPETGTVVEKNPRAARADQAAAAEKLAAMEDKPPTPVNPKLPVSKTDSRGIHLSPDAGPAEALHEVEHVLADEGKGPEPVEGAGAKKYAAPEPAKQPWQMSEEELDSRIGEASRSYDDRLTEVLGPEGAARYNKLYRTSNSMDTARAGAASHEISKIENSLTEEQFQRAFGGSSDVDLEELKGIRDGVGRVGGDTPDQLAESIKWAVTKVNPKSVEESDPIALAQLNKAFRWADEAGWDKNEVLQRALQSSSKRWASPEDAEFMLRNYLKDGPPEQPQRQTVFAKGNFPKSLRPEDRPEIKPLPQQKQLPPAPDVPAPTMEDYRAIREGTKEPITEFSPEASERQRQLEALGGKPEAPKGKKAVQGDLELSKDFGRKLDQQGKDFSKGDINAQIPVIGPFVQHTIAPIARQVAGLVRDGAVGIARAIQPRLFLSNEAADIVMERQGGINIEMDRLRLDKANRQIEKYFDNRTPEQNVDFMDKMMKRSTQQGQQPTKELQDMSNALSAIDEKLFAELQKARPSQAQIDDHFAITWKVKPNAPAGAKPVQVGGPRPIEGSKGFMKQRVYDQLSDGIAAGGVPAEANPFRMLALRAQDVYKFTKTAEMLDKYKDSGLIKFVKPGDVPPDGFKPIDANFSTKWFPTEKGMVKAGQYYWEPNTAKVINNLTSRATFAKSNAGAFLMGAKNYMTQIELAGPFHAAVVTFEAIASNAAQGVLDVAHGRWMEGSGKLAGMVFAPEKMATEGRTFQQMIRDPSYPGLVKLATKYGDLDAYLKDYYNGGGHDGQFHAYRLDAVKSFKESMNQSDFGGAALKIPGVVIQKGMGWLFNHYIPNMRAGLFLQRMASELKDNAADVTSGATSRSTLARRAMDQVDDRLGQMSYDSQFWNSNFKFASQLALRAPGWKLGTIRGFGRALYGQAREFAEPLNISKETRDKLGMSASPRDVRLDPDMAWAMSLFVTTATAAAVIQKLAIGKHPLETDTPWTDAVAPRIGMDAATGKPHRILIPSYMRDVISAAHSPTDYLAHGASPLLSKGIEVLKNKDFYGTQIRTPSDPALQQAWDVTEHMAPSPFAIQNFKQGLKRQGPAAAVAGAVGFAQAPSYISNTKLDDALAERYKAQEKVEGKPKAEAERQKATSDAIKEARRTGDTSAIGKLDIGRAAMKADIKKAGTQGLEARLAPLSLKEVLDLYDKANPEEKPHVINAIRKKATSRAMQGIPPSEAGAVKQRLQDIFRNK